MSGTVKRVAILGGGLGSLVTAAELTGGPNAGRYEVTVYQHGWRLGGKGASGRNAKDGDRIEEHGLHIWFGCYENAFALMREVMREWKLPPGHPWDADGPENRWRHAFKPAGFSALAEHRGGNWDLWQFELPERDNGEPGDGRQIFDGLWSLLGEIARALMSFGDDEGGPHRKRWKKSRPARWSWLRGLWTLITLPLRAWHLYTTLRLSRTLGRLLGTGAVFDPVGALHKARILLNLGLAVCWGLLCNWWRIWRHTFDAIDDMELREFLTKYGASADSANSPVVISIYDAVFAQVGGDAGNLNLAAGAGLRSMLRILIGYKHAMFFKMQAGMGDTIFTPLYEVLKARGVKFRFFHEVKSLELSDDRKTVERVRLGRQVTLKNGPDYEPLREVKCLGCWPSEPRWEQIEDAEAVAIREGGYNLEHANNGWLEREEITLMQRTSPDQHDEHLFDHLVLGVSIGAFPAICPELIAANPRFKAMTDNVLTVRTEAVQLWLKTDLAGLGWPCEPPVFGNFYDPLNTWADLSHLLPVEDHSPALGIKNVAYLCGPMPDTVAPADAEKHVIESEDAAVDGLARSFWPATKTAGGTFDRALIASEYRRWNLTPSDRYVLSVAGSTKHRLRPDESGFVNLTLTGDYTRNGWNAGCVEATVMSGMLASCAISGHPRRKDIAYVNGP